MELAFLLLCFWITVISGNESATTSSSLKYHSVVDIDFENTKKEKKCLLAQLNATIEFRSTGNTAHSFNMKLPQNASTKGSFCNIEYKSLLQLNFHGGSQLVLTFQREPIMDSTPKKATYCDNCDYGTWNMSALSAIIVNESYVIYLEASHQDLVTYGEELTDGISIIRALKCVEDDKAIHIPLKVKRVLNNTSTTEVHGKEVEWKVTIKFHEIQVQPFLLITHTFNDPYLCKDVALSHALVITLPLVYFMIFILFYRIRGEYGCPPKRRKRKKKLIVEVEDGTTTIMQDDYSTQLTSNIK